jgi:predicted negative regulator of RcsB-dependent stress response
MPRPIKKRVQKKEVQTETEVTDKLAELKGRLMEKQKAVMAYSIAAGVIILVLVGILYYRYSSGDRARIAENEGYNYYYGEHLKEQMPRQAQVQKAMDLFKKAYDNRKSPRLLLYIANSYYELGKYDDALTTLNDFVKKDAQDYELLPLAYKMMANIQLQKGDKEGALKTLNTLYTSPGGIYKDYALVESARILESEGKTAEAQAKYKELADKFKDSPYYEGVKAKLEAKKEQ